MEAGGGPAIVSASLNRLVRVFRLDDAASTSVKRSIPMSGTKMHALSAVILCSVIDLFRVIFEKKI